MIIFEAWDDDGDITFAPQESIKEQKQKGLLSTDAKKLHEIEASSHEDAMTKHHEKMGWEPYKPM